MQKQNKGNLGKKAYNNGQITKYINIGEEIPKGFVPGRLKLSEEALNSRIKKNREKLNNMTNEEKKQRYEKKSIAMKKAWAKISMEERQQLAIKIVNNGGGWNQEQIHKTVKEKYGVDNISCLEQIKQRKKDTIQIISQDKWGVDHPFQAPENREKAKATIKEKYGVDNIGKNIDVQQKKINTCLEKYGQPYGFNFDKCKETAMKKYGVLYNCLLPQCNNSIGAKSKHTKPNEDFATLLNNYNVKYEREYVIKNRVYDFKIGKIVIEINPFATHNSTWGLFNKNKGKPKDYHNKKTEIAKENGYRCIHIWDWDDENKIIESLLPKTKIQARKCILKPIQDKNTIDDFLNNNHFQGTCKNQKICLGLYYHEELIQVMTFGEPRYNKHYEYELLRLCSKYNYIVIGGAEKLFKYFLRQYVPNSIISYCDYSKFDGKVYNRLGFNYQKTTICKHWYNPKTKEHYTDSYINKLGFDNLFNTTYGKGTSNEKLMKEHNFVEIYDAGQATYIYERQET